MLKNTLFGPVMGFWKDITNFMNKLKGRAI